MSEDVESLRKELEQRTTDELVSILRNRDDEEWRPATFDVVASILRARGLSPEQVVAMGPEGTDVVESEPTETIRRFFSPAEVRNPVIVIAGSGMVISGSADGDHPSERSDDSRRWPADQVKD